MTTASPRLIDFPVEGFQPRFAYGDQAQVAGLTGSDVGTQLGTGFVRLENADIPWTIKYDEVLLVLEGRVTVETADGALDAGPMSCIWLPKGTKLRYRAEKALIFYAIHPANWAEAAS